MAQSESANESVARVLFAGDVMLGRGVGDRILTSGPDYPLAPIAAKMRDADLTIVNLECAITSSGRRWSGEPKAFYFGAPPQAADTLAGAGIDVVSLANNHVLDFDIEGMRETLGQLRRHGIRHAGAGENLGEALAPAIVDCCGMRLGLAAFCDHQEDFAAQKDRPGIAYLDLRDVPAATATLRKTLDPLQHAQVDWPVLSLHWGPNMVFRPSLEFRSLAHAAIDMGWKMVFGHSAHVFQGIEFHHGCPILYAAGDLVDDYYVDPHFRNDHQLLFEMILSREGLQRIDLCPVFIEACRVRPASKEQWEYVVGWMTSLCNEMGTRVRHESGHAWIDGSAC